MSPANVVCQARRLVTGNQHDVQGVRYINTPRPKYVSDGGHAGSKGVIALHGGRGVVMVVGSCPMGNYLRGDCSRGR